jgi:hypothetical protein
MYPSIMPNAVHICHIMTSAPRIGAGADSAEYTGTVVDFEPMPRPRTNRATNKFTHEFDTPSQMDATAIRTRTLEVSIPAATKQERKITPRRPTREFKGSVSQQPRTAQARYGAELIKPVIHEAWDSDIYGGWRLNS